MVEYKYYARVRAPFKKKDVQNIGEFISNIENKTTKNILSEIKKQKDHVIHEYIEWDDEIASEKYRLQQVRNIVNHVEVKILKSTSSESVRAFHCIVSSNSDKKGKDELTEYVPIAVVMEDDEKRSQVIKRAKTELINWRDRYKIYNELKEIICVLEPHISKV